jgi:LysR family transcriptional regulator, glycine cleavage system transcriptional activator
MSSPTPSLESLRILVSCVRHGNFSRAAEELKITPAAVSQRMRGLEARLGVRLFRRHGPRLITTVRARALGQQLERAFGLVQMAVNECRRGRQPLRVTCAPTFGARWLVPRLTAYHSLPGADAIVLDVGQAISPASAFDVAVRSGTGPWPAHAAVRLMAERRTPLVSPKLWPAETRATARALARLPLIPDPSWPEWFELVGLRNPKPNFISTRFPNYELEAQAAAKGAGAALLSPLLFQELIAQGALVAPFSQCTESVGGYWLLWGKEAGDSHFVRWMRDEFKV